MIVSKLKLSVATCCSLGRSLGRSMYRSIVGRAIGLTSEGGK